MHHCNIHSVFSLIVFLTVSNVLHGKRRYDPVALLCALPVTRHFFDPTIKNVQGVRHLVVGTSPENPGLRTETVDELQDFMYTNFFRGVTLDYSEFTSTLAVVKQSDELSRRRQAEEERHARGRSFNLSSRNIRSLSSIIDA